MRAARVLTFSVLAVAALGVAALLVLRPGARWPRPQAPGAVGKWARASARRMTVPGLVAGGILIGLCTVPCSGAVYLAVLSLLAAQADRLAALGYLLLYNVMFILPLAALLVASSSRPVLARLARWNLAHRERMRLGLGTGVVLLGFAILVTV